MVVNHLAYPAYPLQWMLQYPEMALLERPFCNSYRIAQDVPDERATQRVCVSQIPLAWGEYRGGSQQSGLAFQDNSGKLRFVTNIPCDGVPQVALELRRTKQPRNSDLRENPILENLDSRTLQPQP
jgi:hypothetical protein